MTAEQNLRALTGYLVEHDERFLAEDAVFTDMSSGQASTGRAEIAAMLNWFYHVAFDATAESTAVFADDDHGVFEATVIGRHIGEFAGIPATGREFRVPLCVTYDFRDGQIAAGRIYFAVPAFLAQVGALER